ncbi:MAG: elongation factor G [Alphaproteobacteria bacterium]|nr:elongation factor G [Alphaproteobacteria bacterium]
MSELGHRNGGTGPRTVALVGPYGAGKTTLLESLLWITGATSRKGSVRTRNSIGDYSPEARSHQMSTAVSVAMCQYLGDSYTFLDCPGSIEFLQETINVLPSCDAAVVVAEPEPSKAAMLQPMLKLLEDMRIPHFLFLNKIDKAQLGLRDLLPALSPYSQKPLVLRQIPIREKGIVTGFIDLALERAYVYREHAPSEVIAMPKGETDREKQARFDMLERLADYDDHLMEELLDDIEPPRDEVFGDLARELRDGLIVPVFFGSAEGDNGMRRLLKALRHEVPSVAETAKRLGAEANGEALLHVLKTEHGTGGKLSIARVLSGEIKDGAILHSSSGHTERAGGLFSLLGEKTAKLAGARAGDTLAISRLESVQTGETLTSAKTSPRALSPLRPLEPTYRLGIHTQDRKDEVKLTAAIAKLIEEDPSLAFGHDPDTHEMLLSGQGEIHLKVALERLLSKYGLKVDSRTPRVPYKESIRKGIVQRGRHKRQTGGHGQFGDVVLDIQPLPRGSGFVFQDAVVGGAVPRQWIPSVEKGVREALTHGPLGFPVVDVSVTLKDGSYHSVDSSDAAFQTAGRIAIAEGLPDCSPVLLEPVMSVQIHVPSDATSKVNGFVTARRGQLLGFDTRPGWPGWDTVSAFIPQAELHGLIVELRSATMGTGTYSARFAHLAELTGKLADHVLAHAKAA